MKKRVFSGIQPSGGLHLGNYLGAIRQWVRGQAERDNVFCIVDLHSITVPQEPKVLRKNVRELAALYFACGIDPEQSTVFVQSHVTAHSELAWILNCFTPMGWMQRMTQFKDKSAKQKQICVGLFDYPALMAADILLYDTDEVPVGEDQKQHVELTRDIAQLMNGRYGNKLFKIPEPVIPKTGARIMGLDDPTKKMAKSDDLPKRTLYLLDEPTAMRKKIMSATTDSLKDIRFDEGRPGIFNLLTIYQLISGEEKAAIEARFEGKQYSDLKKELADLVVDHLSPIAEKARHYLSDPAELDAMLAKGADKARVIAGRTMKRVHEKIGLG